MPIVFESPYASIGEGIRTAGGALAESIGEVSKKAREQKKQEKYGSILQQTLGSLPGNATSLDMMTSYSEAIKQGVPESMAKNYVDMYSKIREAGVKSEDIGKINEIASRIGPDATFDQWSNELYLSGVNPESSQKFLLNKYRGELIKAREEEGKIGAKRLSREEKNQKIKLLESDYKEQISGLKDDMKTARLNFEDEEVKRLNQEINNLQKQRVKDRRRVMENLNPVLYDGDQEEPAQPEGAQRENDLNAILFG